MEKNEFFRAHLARDPRFDGKFFVAVKTTKIYCRSICPARKAKFENLEFFLHAAQAQEAGYRPCLRCRPETAPGCAAWLGTSATVKRAIRLMDCYALENLSVRDLSTKLGIGERWLRELFQKQVGISPQSILMTKKLDTAMNLLESSSLSITEIAFSSGFQSLRRFNDAFKLRFQKTPSDFRKNSLSEGQLRFYLSYRPPYSWTHLLNFFKKRAISRMEFVDDDSYQRLITYNNICGWLKVKNCKNNKIEVEFKLNKPANILEFISRIKNIFDLDADPMSIESCFLEDKNLKPYIQNFSGLRVPGCWDGFELAVRGIVGQKISVKAAKTVLERIVEICGEKQSLDESLPLKNFFPTPENILAADLALAGLTKAKIETIKNLALCIANKTIVLDGTADFAETCKKLLAIKGIGRWTVEYIAMRALRDPNSFPSTDLEIQKKVAQLQLDPQKWIPWRSYGAIFLWNWRLDE